MRTAVAIFSVIFIATGLNGCSHQTWREKAPESAKNLPWLYSETPWYEEAVAQSIVDKILSPEEGNKYLRFYSDQDPGKDFKWDLPRTIFEDDANRGDAQAQAIMGFQNLIGYNAPCDTCSSLKWLSEAAQQQHPIAHLYLSAHYFEGYATEPNLELACWAAEFVNSHYGFEDMEIDDMLDSQSQSSFPHSNLSSTSVQDVCLAYARDGFSSNIDEKFQASLLENTKLQPCPTNQCPVLNRR